MLLWNTFTKKMMPFMGLVLSALLFTGCPDDDSSAATNMAVDEVVATNAVALGIANQGVVAALNAPVATAARAEAAQPAATIQPRVINCDPAGTAEVTGDVTVRENGRTFDLVIGYDNCVGLNGGLLVNGLAQSSGTSVNFTYTLNGTLTNEDCTLDYTNLTVSVEGTSATLDGLLDAECDDTAVSCVYNSVNAADQTGLRNACS